MDENGAWPFKTWARFVFWDGEAAEPFDEGPFRLEIPSGRIFARRLRLGDGDRPSEKVRDWILEWPLVVPSVVSPEVSGVLLRRRRREDEVKPPFTPTDLRLL